MKKDKELFSLSGVVSLLSQLLLVIGYFLAYAIKGMPKIDLIMLVHAGFVINFIKAMGALEQEFPKRSKGYCMKMAKLIFLNLVVLSFSVFVWRGLPGT